MNTQISFFGKLLKEKLFTLFGGIGKQRHCYLRFSTIIGSYGMLKCERVLCLVGYDTTNIRSSDSVAMRQSIGQLKLAGWVEKARDCYDM